MQSAVLGAFMDYDEHFADWEIMNHKEFRLASISTTQTSYHNTGTTAEG